MKLSKVIVCFNLTNVFIIEKISIRIYWSVPLENTKNSVFLVQQSRAKILVIKIAIVRSVYSLAVAILKYPIILMLLLDNVLFHIGEQQLSVFR